MENFEKTPGIEVSKASSTVDQIINKQAKIKFISSNLERRDDWPGEAYCYEVELEHPVEAEKTWTTELLVWHPSVDYESARKRIIKPEMEIDINTSQGFMRLTNDRAKREQIFRIITEQATKLSQEEAV
jgi:hypothetical protein